MSFTFPLILGASNEFKLDERAFRHIVEGDFSKRPETDAAGNRVGRDVLTGGLHTWSAWLNFLVLRPEIVHLHDFDPNLHSGWYFARELQNGVITLRIPRSLFSKDAANITMMPDVLFKSGYLWKTLFPSDYGEGDIISVIAEALLNVSVEESQLDSEMKVIIGYARTMEPLTAIRIRIQTEGEFIRSAFPSWDQPNTGNNGKPYSPEQSLSFVIAESTIGATGGTHLTSSLLTKSGPFNFLKLIEITPSFIIKRPFPRYGAAANNWRDGWIEKISRTATAATADSIHEVVSYLSEFLISKEPFFLQSMLFKNAEEKSLRAIGMGNCAAIMQNVNDCFCFLIELDNKRGTRYFIELAQRFMATAVIHTGYLNLLEFKRLLRIFLSGATRHYAPDAIKIVWESLATSPWRIAAYSEINIYPYLKKNDEQGWGVIGGFHIEVPVTTGLVYDWVATNLGETYLLSFSKSQRLKIARAYVCQGLQEKFAENSLKYFVANDFDFFAEEIDMLLKLNSLKLPPSEPAMIDILREYDKILLIYRQRIILEDREAYTTEVDYGDRSGPSFEILKQKHKRSYVLAMHERLFSGMEKIAHNWSYKKLALRVEKLREKMGKERIPVPTRIPDYIESWETEGRGINRDVDGFFEDPLFGQEK